LPDPVNRERKVRVKGWNRKKYILSMTRRMPMKKKPFVNLFSLLVFFCIFSCLIFTISRGFAETEASFEELKQQDIERGLKYEKHTNTQVARPNQEFSVNALPVDTDDDGVPDTRELANGLNPHNPNDAWFDPDGSDLKSPSISTAAAGQWSQKTSGATPRVDDTGVVHDGQMYIYAGNNDNPDMLNDLWQYSVVSDNWTYLGTTPPALTPRDCHSAVVYNDKMYVFGGFQYPIPQKVDELWEYDFISSAWTQKTSGATGRNHHSAVVYDGKIYIFGGKDNRDITLNDLWEHNITTDTWIQKKSAPAARREHSAVAYNKKMYIFGGTDNTDNISDALWEYDFTGNNWTQKVGAPFSIAGHSAVVYDGRMYVFGGGGYFDAGKTLVLFNDIWKYDFEGDIWAQETTSGTPPSERYGHSSVVYNRRMYLFGGWNGEYLNDLWEYSFSPQCGCDINEDREVTPIDALCAFQKYLVICPTACGSCEDICCDVNMDEDCTPADALEIFKEYLGIRPNACSAE
jgi:N-acetylneuraminic acid mutarotase